MMPRTKPRNVDGLRIDLGTKERMILEDFALSYRLQATLPSLAAILKDASALYAIAIIIEFITGKDIPGDMTVGDDIGEREAEVYLEMLRVLTRGLLVLGALGGAGITASQLGLV